MRKPIFWIVSAKHRFVKRLQSTNIKDVQTLCNGYKAMYLDATICTNECATHFGNGLVFNNGKLTEE